MSTPTAWRVATNSGYSVEFRPTMGVITDTNQQCIATTSVKVDRFSASAVERDRNTTYLRPCSLHYKPDDKHKAAGGAANAEKLPVALYFEHCRVLTCPISSFDSTRGDTPVAIQPNSSLNPFPKI